MKFDIADIALSNLKVLTGISACLNRTESLDGVLKIVIEEKEYSYAVEIKRELRMHQLHQVESNFKKYDSYLLLANRLSPKEKEALRGKAIPYLEANGNIFLKEEGLLIWIDTQKPLDEKKDKGNRAFTKTGLKVLFYLLQHKEAINLPQRALAELTGVGLGNIPQVLEGLQETGYLLPLNKKTFVWENRKELLERWIAAYESLLRPKLRRERYTYNGKWEEIVLDPQNTVWGSEPAADMLTNHLRPQKLTLYTREMRTDLIRHYKLIPDKNGEIEVLEMFWKEDGGITAPPLLVYADLILEGGKRNKQTAEKIYNDYIQPNL
jgi:hypothetical protein